MKVNGGFFHLIQNGTTAKKEMMAGAVGFFTTVYIVAVNAFILSEAGIQFEGAVLATILASFFGCMAMAIWANTPILLVPGMGINAMFTYTFVGGMGLSWQEALGVVFVSGLLLLVVSATSLAEILNKAIPAVLKEAIFIGLGLFLMLIGLEKGGLVVSGANSIIALGNLSDPKVLVTIATLLVSIVIFISDVKGGLLWGILFGTVLSWIAGLLPQPEQVPVSFSSYVDVFAAVSFERWLELPFWIAVFSMTMVITFENIGLVSGHTKFAGHPEKFKRGFQATAFSSVTSGLFGTSPTVATVETSAAIAAGGRTGLTSITTGILFLLSILAIPYMKLIPDMAIAPVLIIIGGVMVRNIVKLDFNDLTEAFPAIIIIVMIPFTYSIADGMAMGFILYPLLKLVNGKGREVSFPLYLISTLFLIYFFLHYI